MSDILDDFSKKERPISTVFSKISFVFGIITLGVALLTFFEYHELKKTLIPPLYIVYSIHFLFLKVGCGAGIMMSFFSYTIGEPANFYKIIGALINFFMAGIILFLSMIPIPTVGY